MSQWMGIRCVAAIGVFAVAVFTHAAPAGPPDVLYGQQTSAVPEDTSEIIVFLEPGANIGQFAREHGLAVKAALRSDPGAFVLTAASPHAARALSRTIASSDRRVRGAYVNQRTHYVRLAFVPNDPYFHKDTPSAGWPGQWHLLNEYTPGLDARVQGAWNRDVTGSGVTVGIVDDGLETSHPDLTLNYVAGDSWDFGQNDDDPNPVYADDQHGVSTAGVAAARGGNGIGITGAAPFAGLAGLRIDFYNQTTQMFVDATLYHSSGSNTAIKIKNHSYGMSYPYVSAAAEVSALATSAAAGTIHCLAAGNDRGYAGQDSNTKDLQHSPHGICVTALGSDGKYASYSCFGACVFVTAPSSSAAGLPRVTTTDRLGEAYGYNGANDAFPDPDYTARFGGTSSAAPLVAGVMAMVKQVQPALDVRFAKHLLARTSDVVDAADSTYSSDGGWTTNAAGFRFNQNYGFGLVDADELTQMAVLYSGVTPLLTESTGTITVGAAIPDNVPEGFSRTFSVAGTTPLEEVLVTLNVTHPRRGQIEARLVSPGGTVGRLISRNAKDPDANLNWTFCTNAFWGEIPAGTWTLQVADVVSGDTGTWNSYAVTMRMGTLQSARAPEIAQQPAEQRVALGGTATFTVQATGFQPLSYRWQKNQLDLTDGGKISGATSSTLHVANCDVDEMGSYRCVITNAYGSVTSNPATLTVALTFIVESRSGGQNYTAYSEYAAGPLADSSAKSTAPGTTSGIGSRYGSMDYAVVKLKWAKYTYTPPATGLYEVFVTWPSSTNASDAVEHIVTHAGGSASLLMDQNSNSNPAGGNHWNSLGQYNLNAGVAYTVTQTNQNYPDPGYIFRADAVKWELISIAGGPTITQQPAAQELCPGSTATFTVSAMGEGTIAYQWQKGGANLSDGGRVSGATTATLQITDVATGDVGDYRCILTDANGTTRSTAATLALDPTVITRHPTSQSVPLAGGVAVFSVEAAGKGTLTYQWQKNQADLTDGGKISGATTGELRISNCDATDAGSYRCIVTGTCGSATSDGADLTVTSDPIVFIVETRVGGQNRDRYTEFGVLADSAAKSTAAGTTPGVGSRFGSMDRAASGIKRAIYSCTAPATGTYELFATWPASTNASRNIEYQITHAGGTSSVFMNQDNTSNPAGANHWNSLGLYTLNAGATCTVTQTNENYPDPGKVFRADAVKWEYHPPPPPTITQQPVGQNVCPNSMAVFSVLATGEGTLLYRWQKNGLDVADGGHYSGAATPTLTVYPAGGGDQGDYRCAVTNAGGITISNPAPLSLMHTAAADLDEDCDADLADFSLFQMCFNGPNRAPSGRCTTPAADLDEDGDVDLNDFSLFQACFNGPNRVPKCP